MKRPLTLALSVLVAAGLTACVAETPGGSGAGSSVVVDGGTASPAAQQSPLSPLEAFEREMYGLNVSAEEREQQRYEESVEMENLIAQCMKAEGFEYTPEPYRPDLSDSDATADGITDENLEDRDWVARYGYGLVETPDRAADDMSMFTGPDRGAGTKTESERYVDTLSSSQAAAYELAMNGPQQTEENFSLADAGCFGQARAAVVGEDPSDLAEFEPTFEAIEDFWNGASSWAGFSELHASWASCMDARGHGGYARQSDAANEIGTKIGALREVANPTEGTGEMVALPIAALEALGAEERELATVDLDCREEVGFSARFFEIKVAEETRFIADHQAALDELKAAYQLRGRR